MAPWIRHLGSNKVRSCRFWVHVHWKFPIRLTRWRCKKLEISSRRWVFMFLTPSTRKDKFPASVLTLTWCNAPYETRQTFLTATSSIPRTISTFYLSKTSLLGRRHSAPFLANVAWPYVHSMQPLQSVLMESTRILTPPHQTENSGDECSCVVGTAYLLCLCDWLRWHQLRPFRDQALQSCTAVLGWLLLIFYLAE